MWVEEASTVDISHITRFFTNQQYDKESGLYYYNARYYDPHLGSFLTPDPGMSGLNHYAYANANPIKYTDPTGFMSEQEASTWMTGVGISPSSPNANPESYPTGGSSESYLSNCLVREQRKKEREERIKAWDDKVNEKIISLPHKQKEYEEDAKRHLRYYETWGRFPTEWVTKGEIPYLINAVLSKSTPIKTDGLLASGKSIPNGFDWGLARKTFYSYPLISSPISKKEFIAEKTILEKGRWTLVDGDFNFNGPEEGSFIPWGTWEATCKREVNKTEIGYTRQEFETVFLNFTNYGISITSVRDIVIKNEIVNSRYTERYNVGGSAFTEMGARFQAWDMLLELRNRND